MLTVVAKLLNLVRPAVAFFGEKDYQQLVLITRMAGDLELGVGIAGVPTVREPDGLALSSRNVYLSADDRVRALALSRALAAGRAAAGTAQDVLAAALGRVARGRRRSPTISTCAAPISPTRPNTVRRACSLPRASGRPDLSTTPR